MENYQVSARKYRPSTFDSVVGQKALTATLRNAIATQKLAHAYLFCGSRGVGKTSCARIFAKTINCEHPTAEGNPCNECPSCKAFNQNRSLNIVELDAASNNSVDNIRELIDQVQIPPTDGKYRVFIIDEVHMLSSAAFNAFLKTLEEPPSYVIFILATTEKHKILPTILSRCQIYDFNRITVADITSHLQFVAQNENISAERSALGVIAEKADGAMRDALSIFDQVAASSRGNITYRSAIDSLNVLDRAYYSRLFECIRKEDIPGCLLIFKEIRDNGFDTLFFINGLARHLRTLMLASSDATLPLVDAEQEALAQWRKEASEFQPQFYYAAMSLVNDADLNYRQASDKTFLAELLLIKLCQQLSPSPVSDGAEEGRLKPIAARPMPGNPAPVPVTPATGAAATKAPVTAATPSPRPRRHRSPMLKDLNAPEVLQQEQTATVKRNGEYTAGDVRQAWNGLVALRRSEPLLYNAIRGKEPVEVGENCYAITLDNHIQEAEINSNIESIYSYIRDAISNDFWTLTINVDSGEGSPETWNDREVLTHILEESEPFARLYKLFKLKL